MELVFRHGKLQRAIIHEVVDCTVNDCRRYNPPFLSITADNDDGSQVTAFYSPKIAKRLSDTLAALFPSTDDPAGCGDPLERAIDNAIGPPDELLARAATTPVDAVAAMMDDDREESDE